MTVLAGKYQLGDKIGGGGMAEVYAGQVIGAEGFERPVAIKRVLAPLSSEPRFGEMFVNEARIASLLHHRNIVSVLDFDQDDEGRYYLVMELVRGVDLRRLLGAGRLPIHLSVFVVAEVLRGLAYAHELVHEGRHLGIVHRDISPHNVMISWSGGVKVVDFGIAKAIAVTGASRSGALKGKLAYMSPEQANGDELDGRSDVFAVGIMLHELLTGERLFRGRTEAETLASVFTRAIPPPKSLAEDVPEDLDELTMSLLERDPARRVASASLALEALVSCSSSSARAGLDLRELLKQRFPEEVPARADLSGPTARAEDGVPREVVFAASSGRASDAVPRPIGVTAATVREGVPVPIPAAKGSTPVLTGETLPFAETEAATPLQTRPTRLPVVLSLLGLLVVVVVTLGLAYKRGPSTGAPLRAAQGERDGGAAQGDASTGAPLRAAQGKRDGGAAQGDPSTGAPLRAAQGKRDGGAAQGKRDGGAAQGKRDLRGRGTLKIVVEPWAIVKIDGKNVGETPVIKRLPAGTHRITLINEDLGKRERLRPRVRAGKTTTVRRKWGTAFQ